MTPRSGPPQGGDSRPASEVPVVADGDGVRLAGSVWLPAATAPRGLILMHPGSGPSDRDNDILFPPIRSALLAGGVAVCSFDKRGVGGSSGRWLEAGIGRQAGDLARGLRAAREIAPAGPVGLFGHSQGGWVVLEAAGDPQVEFVITNSGPAVTPAEQERYSTRNRLVAASWSSDDVDDALAFLDLIFELVDSQPFEKGAAVLQEHRALADRLAALGAFLPDLPELWSFAKAILRHDPRHAIQSLTVPLLALYGARDPIVPVAQSATLLGSLADPKLLNVRVLPDGDHRLHEPASDQFVPDYLMTVADFVEVQCRLGQSRKASAKINWKLCT